jgi:hypothetical protein
VAAEPSPAADEPDEPLEAFYGDEADEVQRLAETSGGEAEAHAEDSARSSGARWRTPVAGALMAGISLGLRDVLQPEYHDRIAVEQPAPEQPLEPQKYEIHLDPVTPESSFAIYRPWVDEEDPGASDPDGSGSGDAPSGSTGGGTGALGG